MSSPVSVRTEPTKQPMEAADDDAASSSAMVGKKVQVSEGVACTGHSGRVNTVRFLERQSGESGYVVSGGADGVVRLWSVPATSAPLLIHGFAGGHASGDVLGVACASGGLRLASVGVDRAVALWDVSAGRLWARLHGHEAKVNCCAFGGSTLLATGSADCSLRLWDVRARAAVQTLPRFGDAVTSVALDEAVIIGSSVDGTVRTFDVRAGKCLVDRIGMPVGNAVLSRDGKLLLASCVSEQRASLHLLDRSNGSTARVFTGHKNASLAISACFDNSDAMVSSGSEDGVVRFWEISTGNSVAEVQCDSNPILGISHHNTRQCFVVCGLNGLIKCYTWNSI